MRARPHRHSRILEGVLSLVMGLTLPGSAIAAPSLLDSLELSRSGDDWQIEIGFASPIRVLRHAPEAEGAVIEVAVDAFGQAPAADVLRRGEEVLVAPRDARSPLRDVRFELDANDRPVLLLRFFETVRFDLRTDPDFRSLTVVAAKARAPRRSSAAASTLPTAAAGERSAAPIEELMIEGEKAMVSGDTARAVSLYTLVVTSAAAAGEPTQAEKALELLGLARQRASQVAHARAEYQEYLLRCPNGEGADRVRQRLAALDTAVAPAPGPRRRVTSDPPARFDVYGSLYTSYFRTESFADLSGASLLDSSQLADADVTARLRRGSLEVRGRASGYFRYDFREGSVDTPSRVTRLYLDAEENDLRLSGRLGRQSSQGAGVLGRFDGLTLGWGFHDRWTLKGVAGFPLASSVGNGIDTSRQVFGASIEARELVPGLHTELYAVGQRIDGTTDRVAAGLEARYVDEVRSVFGLLDYDFHFLELNLAMLSGSWRFPRGTTANVLIDYRFAPFLTTRNALIGQPGEDLDSLRASVGESGVKQLARDRTSRVTTLVAGASHPVTDQLDLNGDFTATQTGATAASGGVPAYPASDWEFFYTGQLVVRDWLMDGGTERVAIRIFDGERQNSYAITLGGRYYLLDALRLTPELRFDYRDSREGRDYVELDPRLRIEYRIGPVTLDSDFVLQWIQGVGSVAGSPSRDELGYSLHVGARYDF